MSTGNQPIMQTTSPDTIHEYSPKLTRFMKFAANKHCCPNQSAVFGQHGNVSSFQVDSAFTPTKPAGAPCQDHLCAPGCTPHQWSPETATNVASMWTQLQNEVEILTATGSTATMSPLKTRHCTMLMSMDPIAPPLANPYRVQPKMCAHRCDAGVFFSLLSQFTRSAHGKLQQSSWCWN